MSIRQHCTDFVVELISQLKHRLPDYFEILKKIDAFSVQNILRANKDPIIQILELFAVNAEEIEKIVFQYNTVHLVQWKNQEDTVSLWSEVNKHMDSAGNKQFESLSLFAINLLSLPWSNAEVERVFSQVNLVKTTLRNRLHIDTLNSILTVRVHRAINSPYMPL
ncbi:uncharacterized protein Dmoj_GI25902 [Drosophila mojavensis]|uniref:HAT C-terminal dimerisation domain-containing protein n=1 Tax=Drosophila mojavensis TaxID=7230 RepID=A0A0Q9X6I5_DROMO|nr:uncharacterized protein Dmoj_GI25902 [Drosophila mojavensis]